MSGCDEDQDQRRVDGLWRTCPREWICPLSGLVSSKALVPSPVTQVSI